MMADLPVPVGPTKSKGTEPSVRLTKTSRKNFCRAVSVVGMIKSLTCTGAHSLEVHHTDSYCIDLYVISALEVINHTICQRWHFLLPCTLAPAGMVAPLSTRSSQLLQTPPTFWKKKSKTVPLSGNRLFCRGKARREGENR